MRLFRTKISSINWYLSRNINRSSYELASSPISFVTQPRNLARVGVTACKHKSQDLQTSEFSARIICKYPTPSTRIKCQWARIICQQPANIAQNPHYVPTRNGIKFCLPTKFYILIDAGES